MNKIELSSVSLEAVHTHTHTHTHTGSVSGYLVWNKIEKIIGTSIFVFVLKYKNKHIKYLCFFAV